MAGKELIIDDRYCYDVAKRCKEKGETFETLLKNYLNILTTAKEHAICDGSAAQALERYITFASMLQGCMDDISTLANITITTFLGEVDDADKYLY